MEMEHKVYVELKKLPSFSKLNERVRAVERSSSWVERYGWDWLHSIAGLAAGTMGFVLLGWGGFMSTITGFFLLGASHAIIAMRTGHLASHGALVESKSWNKIWQRICGEFCWSYSSYMVDDIHINYHHPHTNIIGLGDSSTWKVPSLPMLPYMFFVPLLTPPLTPLLAIYQLIELSKYKELLTFLIIMVGGTAFKVLLFVQVSGYSILGGFLGIWIMQAMFSVSWIHINIFQHIGLPMYSPGTRPARIFQMSTGVLNIERNLLLDLIFSHTLVSCHVEHHLFPRLGDNMCLKIKPLVQKYLQENGLPYHEKTYWDRLKTFMDKYEEYMVKAPPITHFIGIQ